MTLAETYALFAIMKAVHPNHPTPDETVQVYAELLADIAFADAKAAVKHLLKTSSFFPKPAEIIEAAKSAATGLPSGADAWAEVERSMNKTGYYGRPTWSHSAIQATIRALGGWQELCRADVEQVKRRFLPAYRELRDGWTPSDAPALPETTDRVLDIDWHREQRWKMLREAGNATSE